MSDTGSLIWVPAGHSAYVFPSPDVDVYDDE